MDVLSLTPNPDTRRAYLASVVDHWGVTKILARKNFHVRYKRAVLGVAWAVVVPLLQAAVLIVLFSRLLDLRPGFPFGAYVLSGILPWTFFATSLPLASTAVVDGSSLTERVWFPRAILVAVPVLAGLFGLAVSLAVLVVAGPFLGGTVSAYYLLLPVGVLLMVAFTIAVGLCLSALHVYFRDVRYIVSAGTMLWLYVTPVIYPRGLLPGLAPFLDLNPMTGVVTLFHASVLGTDLFLRPILVTIVATIALTLIGLEAHRRHDRLFVDLL